MEQTERVIEEREREREKQTLPAALDRRGKGERQHVSSTKPPQLLRLFWLPILTLRYTLRASATHTHTSCMNNSLLNCCHGEE